VLHICNGTLRSVSFGFIKYDKIRWNFITLLLYYCRKFLCQRLLRNNIETNKNNRIIITFKWISLI